ncbi:MAG: 2-oxoacid:ferredoxin oxidoreductase subunit beta [Spirochaetales bacterium]|nr:2-oxoacid:ferredoxin oxidoreductase subunit beta [Spirochaetales bacterium]
MNIHDFKSTDEIAWCPGCGNFGILGALELALKKSGLSGNQVLLVSGIGQAAKTPHYIKANCFNGLHGRALPVAVAAKMANRNLTVIVTTGDGDCYGEGGNHFLHNIRRNVDITVIVHDNQIYGLTKGQASPTTDPGFVTKVQTDGSLLQPFHPLQTALAAGAGFIARGFSGEKNHLSELLLEAINYRGFALIDVLQPCVSFNKKNTFQWYSERVYKVNEDVAYDSSDKEQAFRKSGEWGKRIPIGIIYREEKATYEDKSGLNNREPLVDMDIENSDIHKALHHYAILT